jgi:lysylphosphatidylglycerol synthetase-like protein (DUF2156 family)
VSNEIHDLAHKKEVELKNSIILSIALIALLVLLAFPVLAAANEKVDAVPVPEFPATIVLVLFAALAASVYILRKRRFNFFEPILCIVLIVLLVPSAVTMATGFLSTAPSRLAGIVTIAIFPVATLVTLCIRLTGKKRLTGLLRIHECTGNTGHARDIFGLNVDPYMQWSTSGSLNTVVGNVWNLG